MTGDYEKLVDREVRAAIQRMQAAEEAKQEGLRTWRLPESLKVMGFKKVYFITVFFPNGRAV